MAESPQRPKVAHVRRSEERELEEADPKGRPQVAIYATAVGLLSALPVPLLDQALASVARGAALRRVAARRGVRITREARDVLSAHGSGSQGHRVVRRGIARALSPWRIASRFQDALSAFAAAMLLEHYLRTTDRPAHAPLSVGEARMLRRAMDSAAVGGVLDTLRAAPAAFFQAARDAARAASAGADHEDRSPLERLVDSVLDAAADAPSDLADRLRESFDRALAETEDT